VPPPEILYLSHVVPNPPNKGERIRSFHQLKYLAGRFRIHLACFGRDRDDVEAARELSMFCESVHVELNSRTPALLKAGIRFLGGASLNTSFYRSGQLLRHVQQVHATRPIRAALVYSAVMFPYVPAGVPIILDIIDVDSEKWFSYATERRPGFLYAMEARRLRKLEVRFAEKAALSLFTTRSEEELFRSFSPTSPRTAVLENGVDFEYFDPDKVTAAAASGKRNLVFTGTMDYQPNIEAACGFVSGILPELRRADPALEFTVVGRNPPPEVLRLAETPGVHVTGAVPDVRPYLKAAHAVVAPLRIARGIQNKVLEGLAMGKRVFVSPAVALTFDSGLPPGVIACGCPRDYLQALEPGTLSGEEIREATRKRFTWDGNQLLADVFTDLIANNTTSPPPFPKPAIR
jgi:sugar transferase (PEP-CTERM/EpsH1 system associated)